MKKIIAILALSAVALATVIAAPKKGKKPLNTYVTGANMIVVGTWNEEHNAYTMDLSKIVSPDCDLVLNDDGSLDVTYNGNYGQFIIPIPCNSEEFMENIQSCIITVSSDYTGDKKFAYKVTKSLENSYGSAGGPGGQGTNCLGYAFRDYTDEWDYTDLTIWFNKDPGNILPFTFYKGVQGVAICNNTTKTPFTMHIENIVWYK